MIIWVTAIQWVALLFALAAVRTLTQSFWSQMLDFGTKPKHFLSPTNVMPASRTVSENSVQIDDNESSPTTSKADLDAASTYSQSQRANAATSSRDILVFLVAFRILNALCIKTFFQPDEYFQSLEPAWRIAFGPDSGAWITWVWPYLSCFVRGEKLTITGMGTSFTVNDNSIYFCRRIPGSRLYCELPGCRSIQTC